MLLWEIHKFYINNRTISNKAVVLVAFNIDNRARQYAKRY